MAPTTATRWTLSDDRLERGRQRVAVGHLLAAVPALGGLPVGTLRFGLGPRRCADPLLVSRLEY